VNVHDEKKFEAAKGVIKSRKSKDIQYNGQKENRKTMIYKNYTKS
jgi:hypothetical protein